MATELPEYNTLPGRMDAWVRFTEEKIIPLQESKGTRILTSFVGEEDENLHVWIRRFDSHHTIDSYTTNQCFHRCRHTAGQKILRNLSSHKAAAPVCESRSQFQPRPSTR